MVVELLTDFTVSAIVVLSFTDVFVVEGEEVDVLFEVVEEDVAFSFITVFEPVVSLIGLYVVVLVFTDEVVEVVDI